MISTEPSLCRHVCHDRRAVLALALHILRHVPNASIDYAALALGAFASWAGVPGPGEPLLIAAAIVAAHDKLDIAPVLIWAWAGATVGGVVGWLVGRIAGRGVMTAPGPFRQLRLKAVARGEEVFQRFTVTAILLAPSWVSGINRAGTAVYLIINTLSAAAWAVGIGLAAYYIGPPVIDLLADVGTVSAIGLVALVLVGIWFEVRRRRRRKAQPS
jgi:membrane protein DedA with SNARE-associated domain